MLKCYLRNVVFLWDRFLIGGDGNLYEGRGWRRQVQGTQPPQWNYLGYTFFLGEAKVTMTYI